MTGLFDIAIVYDGHVLAMAETRCYDIAAAGECVKARVEQLKLGCPNEESVRRNSHDAAEMAADSCSGVRGTRRVASV